MSPRIIIRLFLFTVVTFVAGAWLLRRGAERSSELYASAVTFNSVVERIASLYVDTLDEARLYDLAIDGMLEGLGDPYTGYLRHDELEDLLLTTRGDYSGLGVRIEVTDGWLTVVSPLTGTPAEEAGIKPGDRIIEVEGMSTFGWSSDRASAALRGDAGTEVAITVLRAGSPEPLRFDIERERIHVTSVPYADIVQPGIGYIRLETVGAQSADELGDAVERVRRAGARALILDLRYNPGGLLDQGVAVADLFLDPGQGVVTTRGRAAVSSRTYSAEGSQRWAEMPLVVLVNEFSASAAEIVAGALQDHDRGLVLGTSSFGKGVVQTIFQISRTEALRLTTSRWYTPSGRSIHRERDGASFEPDSDGAGDSVVVAPEFRSDGGRVLEGGGGIHPDVIARADTATEAERRFQRQLGSDVQTFVDVVSSYALELSGREAVGDAAPFAVTGTMRLEVLRRLRERGIEMPDATWEGAAGIVGDELRRRVLRYAVGREAEIRDRVAADGVVQRAIDLLGNAATQDDLYRSVRR